MSVLSQKNSGHLVVQLAFKSVSYCATLMYLMFRSSCSVAGAGCPVHWRFSITGN